MPEAFKPSDRQVALKMRLMHHVAAPVLSRITAHTIDMLLPYIGAISPREFNIWTRDPAFIEYLISPDEVDLELHLARSKAKDVLLEALDGDFSDPKIMALRLKAAEYLLERDATRSVKNVTQKLQIGGNMRHLEKKTVVELQEELTQLESGKGL